MTRRPAKIRLALIIAGWLVLIALAATLDRAVAAHVHDLGTDAFLKSHKPVRELLKTPGFYPFTIFLSIVIAFIHREKWRAGVFLLIATLPAGLNEAIKWIVGRARPFKTLTGDSSLLTPFQFHPFPPFSSKNLCFPSGHAALAFATAAALSILLPRWRWIFFVLATCVAAERVLENAHWLSDATAAVALGVGGVWCVRTIWWDRKFPPVEGNDSNGIPVPVAGDTSL